MRLKSETCLVDALGHPVVERGGVLGDFGGAQRRARAHEVAARVLDAADRGETARRADRDSVRRRCGAKGEARADLWAGEAVQMA